MRSNSTTPPSQGDSPGSSNPIKIKLERGEVAIGSFLYIPSAQLAAFAGQCGYDFIIVDQEHGPINFESAARMVGACRSVNCTPIVRVSHLDSSTVLQARRMGAMGIHIPGVGTAEAARTAVQWCKQAPVSDVGIDAAHAFPHDPAVKPESCEPMSRTETLVVIHIEDMEAVHNLPELLEVQGVDVYFVGPTDLSNSLGQPGVFDSKLQNIVESTIGRITGAGKVAGIITTDPRAARNYIELGVRYLVTHATHFMTKGAKLFLGALKVEE